ncbi:MAG: 4Fe-4S dicluster domain-containing protein [Candidatus Bathyarchaeota archaeon]|nr:MAG: 4Fe-4S dicluster domain-containing protein [Candidatus Bathyarchaeota archaeon]
MTTQKRIWIVRDYLRCSGCRKCEIACSLFHENKIWPEASRIRVFMLVPGAEVPHLCTQCEDYPCVESCPVEAMSVSTDTGAVLVDKEKCTGCSLCINACPGRIPHIHPTEKYAVICDLCGGKPKCVKVCQKGKWDALRTILKADEQWAGHDRAYELYALTPEEITRDLVINLYGEAGEELI